MHFGSLVGLQTLLQTSERMFDPAFMGSRVQPGVYTILGKTSCTLIRLTKHAFTILYTEKTAYTLTYLVRTGLHGFYVVGFLCSIRSNFT